MKKFFLLILYLFFVNSHAQTHEIGLMVGGSNFIGDVGNEFYWYPNRISGGIIYKYNLNSRIALRGNYTHISLKGNDKEASNPYRKQRGLFFENTVQEFAVGVEFSFFNYSLLGRNTSYTPYILAQFGVFYHDIPLSDKNGGFISKNINENITVKKDLSYTAPVGLGFKGRLGDHFAFAVEAAVRFTLKDDIDYTTSKINDLNYGGNGKDAYVFTGFSIVYTFGRPDCYANLVD